MAVPAEGRGALILKFVCPECGQKLEAATEMGGKGVTCPSCALQFAVPTSGSERVLKPPLALLHKEPPPARSTPELPIPDVAPPTPLVELPKVFLPARPAPPEDVDEEVSRLLAECDPALLAPIIVKEPAPEPAPTDAGSAEPGKAEARPRRVPLWVVLGGGVLLTALLIFGVFLLPGMRRKAENVAVLLKLFSRLQEEVDEIEGALDPPQAPVPQPVAPGRSEAVCFHELGTESLAPLPLSAKRAAILKTYLAEFPSGQHRDKALIFALQETNRAMLEKGELAEQTCAMYRESGRLALAEVLSRRPEDRQGVQEMRVLVTALCGEQPTVERLDWAFSLSREHDMPPVEKVAMLRAGLSEQTPDSHREPLVELLSDCALEIPLAEWDEALMAVVVAHAFHSAEHKPGQGQRLLRLARRLHDFGQDEASLHLLGILLRHHPSGEIRDLATRLQIAWDRGLAAVAREEVLEEARQRHRRELPAVLATINRRKLAARFGLPYPLPPSPSRSVEDALATATAAISKAVAKAFPDGRLQELRKEAEKRYQPYRIGEEVTVRIQRGNHGHETVTGRFSSRNASHVRLGNRDVLLADLDGVIRVRFDPDECERERETVIQQGKAAYIRQREASRRRLLAAARTTTPRAAGYVLWRGRWRDPQELFSQALESAAEAKSKALLRRVSDEMFIRAGFRVKDGEWVPGLPIMPEE